LDLITRVLSTVIAILPGTVLRCRASNGQPDCLCKLARSFQVARFDPAFPFQRSAAIKLHPVRRDRVPELPRVQDRPMPVSRRTKVPGVKCRGDFRPRAAGLTHLEDDGGGVSWRVRDRDAPYAAASVRRRRWRLREHSRETMQRGGWVQCPVTARDDSSCLPLGDLRGRFYHLARSTPWGLRDFLYSPNASRFTGCFWLEKARTHWGQRGPAQSGRETQRVSADSGVRGHSIARPNGGFGCTATRWMAEVHRVFPSFHKRLAPGVWGNLRGCIRLFDAIAPGALGALRGRTRAQARSSASSASFGPGGMGAWRAEVPNISRSSHRAGLIRCTCGHTHCSAGSWFANSSHA
jgi:hypothetical protein